MSNRTLTRRRVIAIVAAAAGSAYLTGRRAKAADPLWWQGSALGAQVSIEIHHPDRTEAERLVEACVQDVHRLEQQFSLYRADFAICTLNRTGILVDPDADMVALLEGLAVVRRSDERRLRSDGAAVVATLCRPFLVREARS